MCNMSLLIGAHVESTDYNGRIHRRADRWDLTHPFVHVLTSTQGPGNTSHVSVRGTGRLQNVILSSAHRCVQQN